MTHPARTLPIAVAIVMSVGLNGCSSAGSGASGGGGGGGGGQTTAGAQNGRTLATDCIRAGVSDPSSGSGSSTVSALLNGDWPTAGMIHAEVQFVGDTSLQTFTADGRSVNVSTSTGALVSTAKVWVTGGDTPLTCNLWVRQP